VKKRRDFLLFKPDCTIVVTMQPRSSAISTLVPQVMEITDRMFWLSI
jgi:hypothetical protein